MATVSPLSSATTTTAAQPTGFGAMSSGDFVKIMMAQLQQQDPLNPSNSDQLLSQLSQISNIQSNQNLSTTLAGLSVQQSIAAGANLIGKTVAGVSAAGDQISGVVTSAKVANKKVQLELDSGQLLDLESVTQIAPTQNATAQAAINQALAGSGLPSNLASSLNSLSPSALQTLMSQLQAARQ